MGFLDYFRKTGLSEKVQSDGYVTVEVRRWNPETKTLGKPEVIADKKHNLLTNAGRIFFHNQVYTNTAAGTRGGNFIAVTNTTSFTPAAADTTLSGELTTNGFARAVAVTITPPTGSGNVTTLAITFTATGNQTAIQGSALFNASSAGTMTHEASFASTDLVTGDTLTVTWTLTLG